MGRFHGKGGRRFGGKKKKKQINLNELTKKQKRHLKDFGEAHPADQKESGLEKYKRVLDVPKQQLEEAVSSSEEEEESAPSAYQQLISSIKTREDPVVSESESGSEQECTDKAEVVNMDEEKGIEQAIEDTDEKDCTTSDEDEKEGTHSEDEDDTSNFTLLAEADAEESEITTDPFRLHYEHDIGEELAHKLSEAKNWTKKDCKLPNLGACQFRYVDNKAAQLAPSKPDRNISKQNVKLTLCNQAAVANNRYVGVTSEPGCLTQLQQDLFNILNKYQDLVYPYRDHVNGEEIRLIYCLHALNHALKTRTRIVSHNAKIKNKYDIPEDFRDQGLTRPKVLIVTPFRESVVKIVNMFITLITSGDQSFVSNKKRFMREFHMEDPKTVKKVPRPDDYEATMKGNLDDHFRLGLGIAKKSLKLYTEFYASDIIIASPLGLRTVIGAEGEEQRDHDFLSSIELLIMDQVDIFQMQNWDHVLHLLSHMHQQPQQAHDVDFSRVRMWTLNGWAKHYRQTLLFSSLISPEILAIYNRHCHNYAGKYLLENLADAGTMPQIVAQLAQVFERIDTPCHQQSSENRFQHFVKNILPQYKRPVMSQTLIFIPSYFDYVRIRNYFKREEMSAAYMSEYSKQNGISRCRNYFFHGKVHFMLYTERLHFYRRFKLRGIRNILFYQLPLYAHFYSELCNMTIDSRKTENNESKTCSILYTKYDIHRLSAIVGSERAAYMVNAEKNVHMFVTGAE